MESQAIVVFGKPATPGTVKTRLCPPLTDELAAHYYDAFARDVITTVGRYRDDVQHRTLHSESDVTAVLAWAGGRRDSLAQFARQQCGFELIDQGGGDLGDRLERVVGQVREMGAAQILVVGSDSPTLSPEHLHTASHGLAQADIVFGPSFDGGYYLVGIDATKAASPAAESAIFQRIDWSTPRVLEQSWERATQAGLLCDLLGFWYDVDTFEDLKKLRFHLCEFMSSRDPLVGQYTREIFESMSLDQLTRSSQ